MSFRKDVEAEAKRKAKEKMAKYFAYARQQMSQGTTFNGSVNPDKKTITAPNGQVYNGVPLGNVSQRLDGAVTLNSTTAVYVDEGGRPGRAGGRRGAYILFTKGLNGPSPQLVVRKIGDAVGKSYIFDLSSYNLDYSQFAGVDLSISNGTGAQGWGRTSNGFYRMYAGFTPDGKHICIATASNKPAKDAAGNYLYADSWQIAGTPREFFGKDTDFDLVDRHDARPLNDIHIKYVIIKKWRIGVDEDSNPVIEGTIDHGSFVVGKDQESDPYGNSIVQAVGAPAPPASPAPVSVVSLTATSNDEDPAFPDIECFASSVQRTHIASFSPDTIYTPELNANGARGVWRFRGQFVFDVDDDGEPLLEYLFFGDITKSAYSLYFLTSRTYESHETWKCRIVPAICGFVGIAERSISMSVVINRTIFPASLFTYQASFAGNNCKVLGMHPARITFSPSPYAFHITYTGLNNSDTWSGTLFTETVQCTNVNYSVPECFSYRDEFAPTGTKGCYTINLDEPVQPWVDDVTGLALAPSQGAGPTSFCNNAGLKFLWGRNFEMLDFAEGRWKSTGIECNFTTPPDCFMETAPCAIFIGCDEESDDYPQSLEGIFYAHHIWVGNTNFDRGMFKVNQNNEITTLNYVSESETQEFVDYLKSGSFNQAHVHGAISISTTQMSKTLHLSASPMDKCLVYEKVFKAAGKFAAITRRQNAFFGQSYVETAPGIPLQTEVYVESQGFSGTDRLFRWLVGETDIDGTVYTNHDAVPVNNPPIIFSDKFISFTTPSWLTGSSYHKAIDSYEFLSLRTSGGKFVVRKILYDPENQTTKNLDVIDRAAFSTAGLTIQDITIRR